MRRPATLLLAPALIAVLLAGCAEGGNQITDSSENAPADGFGSFEDDGDEGDEDGGRSGRSY